MWIPFPSRGRPGLLLPIVLWTVAAMAAVVAVPAGPARAQSLEFADFLYANGDYYRAVTEYQRVLFHAPVSDGETRDYATLRIGEALFAGREYFRAAAWLEPRVGAMAVAGHRAAARRLLCRSLFNTGDAAALAETADDLGEPEGPFYTAVALGMSRRWDVAARGFGALAAGHPFGEVAAHNREVALLAADDGWKSPTRAGVLAVVPGLGYLYTGHRKSALTAFLMNTGFIWAAIEAFDADQDALGAVLGLFSVSWYHGNIAGSVAAADRANTHRNDEYLQRLRD